MTVSFVKHTPEDTSGKRYLYRYVDGYNGPSLQKYDVIGETPCGFWIRDDYYNRDAKKWVAAKGKNTFAKETEHDALVNYYHRKKRQIMILEKRVDRAVRYLKIADNMLHGDKAQSVPVSEFSIFD